MSADALLRRVVAVARHGDLMDQAFVEPALNVRFGAVETDPRWVGLIARRYLSWPDGAQTVNRSNVRIFRVPENGGQVTRGVLMLFLPPTAPCIGLVEAERHLGRNYTIPLVVFSPAAESTISAAAVRSTPLSVEYRLRNAPATFLDISWIGEACATGLTISISDYTLAAPNAAVTTH